MLAWSWSAPGSARRWHRDRHGVGAGIGTGVGAGIGTGVGVEIGTGVGAGIGTGVGGTEGEAMVQTSVGGSAGVGSAVGRAESAEGRHRSRQHGGSGAGVGENVSTETDRTDADDIERRRPVVSSPAEAGPRRRWPSAVAKSISAVVSAPSTTDALSTLVTYCLRRNARAWCVGRFLLVEAEGRDESRS